jgi:oxygen-dependent protoporphyrinogen oxidase
VRLLGALFMTSIYSAAQQAPAGQVALRCLIGGALDPQAVALTDEEAIAVARDGLRRALGLTAAPGFSHVLRWARAIPQYEVGHAERVATLEARGRPLGLWATGAALRGVGVNDVVREAGALASAFDA